ncbi:MAG: head decoration protein [Pseudomonadota bacterium]
MPSITETRHAGEFLLGEWDAIYSQDAAILFNGEGALLPGAVLGKRTADGKYVALNPGGSGGAEVAAGILFEAADSSTGDAVCVVVARDAMVNGKLLDWGAASAPQIVTATAELLAAGIKVI